MRGFLAALFLLSLAASALAKNTIANGTSVSGRISVIDIHADGTAAIAMDGCGAGSCFVPACNNGVLFKVTKNDVLYSAFMSARVTERTVTLTYDEQKPDAWGRCPLIDLIVR